VDAWLDPGSTGPPAVAPARAADATARAHGGVDARSTRSAERPGADPAPRELPWPRAPAPGRSSPSPASSLARLRGEHETVVALEQSGSRSSVSTLLGSAMSVRRAHVYPTRPKTSTEAREHRPWTNPTRTGASRRGHLPREAPAPKSSAPFQHPCETQRHPARGSDVVGDEQDGVADGLDHAPAGRRHDVTRGGLEPLDEGRQVRGPQPRRWRRVKDTMSAKPTARASGRAVGSGWSTSRACAELRGDPAAMAARCRRTSARARPLEQRTDLRQVIEHDQSRAGVVQRMARAVSSTSASTSHSTSARRNDRARRVRVVAVRCSS